ncbi:hypothetical protein FrCorBMG51_10105 [Protofrankia coriariae]|uniref:Uncharacterized protein n=1 Tax=Protofrankia coriariae TaxID=1562887 RepID=A0ABR5F3Z9_9ACTN|nr:hypothetical protein FrCorBMG51_10105 [Protofrankia coriariae]
MRADGRPDAVLRRPLSVIPALRHPHTFSKRRPSEHWHAINRAINHVASCAANCAADDKTTGK